MAAHPATDGPTRTRQQASCISLAILDAGMLGATVVAYHWTLSDLSA